MFLSFLSRFLFHINGSRRNRNTDIIQSPGAQNLDQDHISQSLHREDNKFSSLLIVEGLVLQPSTFITTAGVEVHTLHTAGCLQTKTVTEDTSTYIWKDFCTSRRQEIYST